MITIASTNPPPIHRRITTFRDADHNLRDTAEVFDHLGAEDLAAYRRRTMLNYAAGQRTLHCPECDGALFVCVRSFAFTGILGGGRSYLKHRSCRSGRFCSLATERGRAPGAVNASRFDGLQEGPHHTRRKFALAAALEVDDRFAAVAIESDIAHGDHRRRPDVQARLGNRMLAFEVQHASPLLTTILGRAGFYVDAGCAHIWLLDGDCTDADLLLQGFQDVAWMQGGQVLALSDDTIAASVACGRATVVVLTFTEVDGRIVIDRKPCDLVAALDLVASGDAALPPIACDPHTTALFAALRRGDAGQIRRSITPFCHHLRHAGDAADAETDGLPAALAATATLLVAGKHDASAFDPRLTAAILNNFLTPPKRHGWAPLFSLAGTVSPKAAEHLALPSTARKLAAALSAHGSDTLNSGPVGRWAPILMRVFPQIGVALAQLTKTDPAA